MKDNLISIENFIELARKQGASFGDGDPKVHLAYLTKLGVLPQSTKRKVNGQMTGCYPEPEIETLLKVEQMKNQGMTYSQIAKMLSSQVIHRSGKELATTPESLGVTTQERFWTSQNDAKSSSPFALAASPSFLYLVIGLLFGLLLSALNSQGLAAIQKQANLTAIKTQVEIPSQETSPQSVYLMEIPKQNLDKLNKTNINYLINN